MKSVNGKILVTCDLKQKDAINVAGISLKMANQYDPNYRERSPVVCQAAEGNGRITQGDILIVHHNTLYTPSPYHLGGEFFSIPANDKIVFAILNSDMTLQPFGGNFFCERIEIPSDFPLPPEYVAYYVDRLKVTDPGNTNFKKGQILFTRPHSYYEIVYIINGEQKRVTKAHESNVVGYLSDK